MPSATHIDSCHLLYGVLMERSSRADKLFQLRQRFAEETARVRSLTQFPQARNLPLAEDARRIFALTTEEANLPEELLDRHRPPDSRNSVRRIIGRSSDAEPGGLEHH